MSVRKKTVIKMTVFLNQDKLAFYFHFTAWISGCFTVFSSVTTQPQPPPQPETSAGFNHFAKVSQPCLLHKLDKCIKTEFALVGNTFLNTTIVLHITSTATIITSIISISARCYFESTSLNPNNAMQLDR